MVKALARQGGREGRRERGRRGREREGRREEWRGGERRSSETHTWRGASRGFQFPGAGSSGEEKHHGMCTQFSDLSGTLGEGAWLTVLSTEMIFKGQLAIRWGIMNSIKRVTASI